MTADPPKPEPPAPAQVTWHPAAVERPRGCVVWFTGLSGSGKSTLANAVDAQLHARGAASFLLDGDNLRHGLTASPQRLEPQYGPDFARRFGLGFTPIDREENIRRTAAVAEILCSAGLITLAALVSPYRRDRDRVRAAVAQHGEARDFVEVFVDTPLEVCERRDPKGLYAKARRGEILHFTGVDDPYEPPTNAELTLDGSREPPETAAHRVVLYLESIGKIPPAPTTAPAAG